MASETMGNHGTQGGICSFGPGLLLSGSLLNLRGQKITRLRRQERLQLSCRRLVPVELSVTHAATSTLPIPGEE